MSSKSSKPSQLDSSDDVEILPTPNANEVAGGECELPITRKLKKEGVLRVGTLKKVSDERVDFIIDASAAQQQQSWSFANVLNYNNRHKHVYVSGMSLNWLLLRVDHRLPLEAQLYGKSLPSWCKAAELGELTKLYKDVEWPVSLPTPPGSGGRWFKLVDVGGEIALEVRLFNGGTRWFRKVVEALLYASANPVAAIPASKRNEYIDFVKNKRDAEQQARQQDDAASAGKETGLAIEQRKFELKQAIGKVRGAKSEALVAPEHALLPTCTCRRCLSAGRAPASRRCSRAC
jgi:hypothetical protein